MTEAFEIFLSYSRRDNLVPEGAPPETRGWVTALRDHILEDHRRFSTERLKIFFDVCPESGIQAMDDWRHRILRGLQSSKILLVCLSPNYFRSEYCRWEWEEYLRRQVHQLMGHESIAPVYFVEVPGSDEQQNAADFDRWVKSIEPWKSDVLRSNFIDLRPWFPSGAAALREEEVRRRMAKLGESLWERIQRARRADGVPGNLRRQNPHFVGRREELRRLHEQLGVGSIGVVTAVHGLGGQGKTELAVAYAHGFADYYPAGLWVLGAEGKRDLLPLMGELAYSPELNFTPTEAQKNDPVLLGRAVLVELQRRALTVREHDPDGGAAALVILDNVSEPSLLSTAQLGSLPQADWLRIVATTRLGEESLRASQKLLALIAVDSLEEEDALTLVRDHQPPRDQRGNIVTDPLLGQPGFASPEDAAAAREIVRELGGFTLAVEQVAVYLGLHDTVTPRALLASLRKQGLTRADTLAERLRAEGRAGEILHQQQQLGLILDATLTLLSRPHAEHEGDSPAVTALQFAALLPPDMVPWPWLRALTTARHPELTQFAPDEPDPWLEVRRRLEGLRLLTGGDEPELARIHRLIAAHLQSRGAGLPSAIQSDEDEVITLLHHRAQQLYRSQAAPEPWELDALLTVLRQMMDGAHPPTTLRDVANDAVFFVEKVITYRNLPTASALVAQCHAVMQRLAESDPANAEWQRDLSVSFEKLGKLATAQGNLPDAQRLFGEALRIRQRLSASDPANAAWQRDQSVSFIQLGDLATARGNLPEAERLFGKSLRIAQRLTESDPANADWQRDLLVSFNKLGNLATAQGNQPESRRLFDEAVRIAQRLVESDPANADWQRDLSVSFEKLGDLATAQGNLAEAQRLFGESLRIRQRLAQSDPANAEWQRNLSVSFEKLGNLATSQGNLPEAQRLFGESLRLRQRLAKSDPANAEWQRNLSVSFEKLGDLATAQGNLAEAQRLFGESLRIRQRLAESDPANAGWQRDLSVSFEKLGDLAMAQGNLLETQRLFGESHRIRQRLAESGPANAEWQRDLAASHQRQAYLARKQGDDAGFEAELRECFRVLDQMHQRGLPFDPPLTRLYQYLAGKFGG